MKQIYLLLLPAIILTSTHSNAQLNYLFSASTRAYVPVQGGIVPPLVTTSTRFKLTDEGFAQNIPVGFSFKYDGKSHDTVNIGVNGFITFGSTHITYTINGPKVQNHLEGGFGAYGLNRPLIAPLWDDMALFDSLNLVYKTSGFYPFRVFTVEWKKLRWTWDDSTEAVLSMELKLYETTNIIEFDYKDEGGMPHAEASASIGITSSYPSRDFIAVQSTSSHPEISLLRGNNSLSIKPADNQAYLFVPSVIPAPTIVRSALTYTNNTVSFKLPQRIFNSYEYAVTQSSIAPASGNRTFLSNVTVSSLSPATTYYIYARSSLFGWLRGQWTCDSFTTAVNPVGQPYHINGDPAAGVLLQSAGSIIPFEMRRQNLKDTSDFFSTGYNGWSVLTGFPHIGDTSLWGLNFDSYDADDWIFTPGIKLFAGKKYYIRFGYLSYYLYNVGDPASIEVKYGKSTGAAAMTKTLFAKTDIRTYEPYDEFGGLPLTDTVIEISPERTDSYYFGFHNLSLLTDGIPIIGNFSVSEKATSEPLPVTLNGRANKSDNLLNWKINSNILSTAFNIERSTDGTNFKKIGTVTADERQANRKAGQPILRIIKDIPGKPLAIPGKENSGQPAEKYFEKSYSRIELQRNNIRNAAKHDKTLDYKDPNATGINYYRLKLVDKKGDFSYSNIVALNNSTLSSALNIYPNPAKDVLNLEIGNVNTAKMSMVVTDAYGKIVINKAVDLFNSKGVNRIQLSISNLPAGVYNLKLICNNGCENAVRKFVKE